MRKIILILFLLSAKLTEGQIINGGFEVWDTTYVTNYSPYLGSAYGVPNPIGGIVNHWTSGALGIAQTTDSYSGSYSLILHNWYNIARGWTIYDDTISYRPLFLQGYFKYVKGEPYHIAQGIAKVTLTRFNGVSNDTIATGAFQFDSTASFTPFQLNINYISALNPDSINIYITNSDDLSGSSDVVCNLLYLDDLTLSNSPLGIENLNSNENFVSVFPNPSTNELNIKINSSQLIQFTLYNSFGAKIIAQTLTKQTSTINLSSYSNDIYFYRVNNDKHLIKSGTIIKQ